MARDRTLWQSDDLDLAKASPRGPAGLSAAAGEMGLVWPGSLQL